MERKLRFCIRLLMRCGDGSYKELIRKWKSREERDHAMELYQALQGPDEIVDSYEEDDNDQDSTV